MTLLRCSLCAEHTAEQVQTIIGMFKRAGAATGITLGGASTVQTVGLTNTTSGNISYTATLTSAAQGAVTVTLDNGAVITIAEITQA